MRLFPVTVFVGRWPGFGQPLLHDQVCSAYCPRRQSLHQTLSYFLGSRQPSLHIDDDIVPCNAFEGHDSFDVLDKNDLNLDSGFRILSWISAPFYRSFISLESDIYVQDRHVNMSIRSSSLEGFIPSSFF